MEHVLPAHSRLVRRGRRLAPSLVAKLWSLRKPTRRQLVFGLLGALVLGGGLLWFRGSSFVAVEQVRLEGVRGVQAGPIEAALTEAAKKMSTMDASAGALESAVARFHVVRSVSVSTSFPHTMRISVLEQPPVAALSTKSGSTAVAADGVVLGPALVSRALPQITTSFRPRTGATVGAGRLHGYLTLLGVTPAPLLPLVRAVYEGKYGLTAKLKGGLLVYFGDATRPHAKWASLAAVLANPESAGAIYIDVRVPARPAAGMPEGEGEVGEEGQVTATDPTSAALAASLARAVNGESPIEATSGETAVEGLPEASTEEAPVEEAPIAEAAAGEASLQSEGEAPVEYTETASVGG